MPGAGSFVAMYKWRARWVGSPFDSYAMFGLILTAGQWWNVLVPANAGAPNPVYVGYNLFPAGGGWHYPTPTATLVSPDTWYDFELKTISPGRTAWLKIDGVLEGPFGPGADPADTYGYDGGTCEVQPKAPNVGGLTSAPIYHDDWNIGAYTWLDEGGVTFFQDDFETVPGPDSFVPPWENELMHGLPTDPAIAHVADPADGSNTVGSLFGTGGYIDMGLVVPAIPRSATIKARGGA